MIQTLLEAGFAPSPRPGFKGFARGDKQRCDLFQWRNAKAARENNIPSAYHVICLTLDGAQEDGGRWILPMVEWPTPGQQIVQRPSGAVVAEFKDVFIPLFNMASEEAKQILSALPVRYLL